MLSSSEPRCPSRLHSLTVPPSVLLPLLFISEFFCLHLARCLGQFPTPSAKTAPPPCLLCQRLALSFLSQGLGPWDGVRGRRGPGSPSLCLRPALCTGQVRKADWSPVLRASSGVSMAAVQPGSLGSCWTKGHQIPHTCPWSWNGSIC